MERSDKLLCEDITYRIIGAYREVYNTLGWGFLESVYLNAMEMAVRSRGLDVQREAPLHVRFKGTVVGIFRADLLVEKRVIIELKAVDRLIGAHEAQLLNYLRASSINVGLLFNFGPKFEQRRLIWTSNDGYLSETP